MGSTQVPTALGRYAGTSVPPWQPQRACRKDAAGGPSVQRILRGLQSMMRRGRMKGGAMFGQYPARTTISDRTLRTIPITGPWRTLVPPASLAFCNDCLDLCIPQALRTLRGPIPLRASNPSRNHKELLFSKQTWRFNCAPDYEQYTADSQSQETG